MGKVGISQKKMCSSSEYLSGEGRERKRRKERDRNEIGEMRSENPKEQGPTEKAVPLAITAMLAFSEWGGKLLEGFGQQIDMICLNIITESLQLLF